VSVTGERGGDGGNEALSNPLMMPETLSGDTARQVRLFDRAGRLPKAA
jgi:hypothetical protein